jgi:stalled ribosome rescue protein Dom34
VNQGIWIDHKRAVIVTVAAEHVVADTVDSDVAAHPHYAGQQDGGGEKKYEERRNHQLNQYYDAVIRSLAKPDGLLIFGPGEAKRELEKRIRSTTHEGFAIDVETTDKLTDPQIVAKVTEYFSTGR